MLYEMLNNTSDAFHPPLKIVPQRLPFGAPIQDLGPENIGLFTSGLRFGQILLEV